MFTTLTKSPARNFFSNLLFVKVVLGFGSFQRKTAFESQLQDLEISKPGGARLVSKDLRTARGTLQAVSVNLVLTPPITGIAGS
jgi:hypothetical protein